MLSDRLTTNSVYFLQVTSLTLLTGDNNVANWNPSARLLLGRPKVNYNVILLSSVAI